MIDTLIFDFDGVIIDTETPDYLTWQEVFHSYGVELDRALWGRFIGGGTEFFDRYQHLEDLAEAKLDRAAIERTRDERYLDMIESGPLLPGIMDYITGAKEAGLKIGIASSSPRSWVEGHLERRGLLDRFDSIKGGDQVSKIKPDPELYLASVKDLGGRPHTSLAIEDSMNGLSAAKDAGLLCVVVPNEMTRDMDFSRADLRLEALTDMTLSSLLAWAEQNFP